MTDRLEAWKKPPSTEEEARERCLALREQITEEVGVFYDKRARMHHRVLARLYAEWALEHVQEMQEFQRKGHPGYSYVMTAETDLKDIICRLD